VLGFQPSSCKQSSAEELVMSSVSEMSDGKTVKRSPGVMVCCIELCNTL
jgi:hypothetical protein